MSGHRVSTCALPVGSFLLSLLHIGLRVSVLLVKHVVMNKLKLLLLFFCQMNFQFLQHFSLYGNYFTEFSCNYFQNLFVGIFLAVPQEQVSLGFGLNFPNVDIFFWAVIKTVRG